jgi:hypothetical protein
MTQRLTSSVISPNIAAKNLRLQKDKTVKQYINAKMAYLRRTGLNEQSMADELTDGLPVTYRGFMHSGLITNTNEWLIAGIKLEADKALPS